MQSNPAMEVGVIYTVTHPSEGGEFRPGDRIILDTCGAISCREAAGWIDREDVADATKGMRVEVDAKWLAARRQKLLAMLAELDGIGINTKHFSTYQKVGDTWKF